MGSTPATTLAPPDPDWPGLAAEVAQMPGVPEKLLAEHVPDHTGHCTRCVQHQNGCAPRHPCRLYAVADLALALRNTPREGNAR